MTWLKVDDSFFSHPKVLATDPAALGLWVVAGSWCGANLTDGFVPDHVLPRLLTGAELLAPALVTAGLWRRAKGGYRFHDWSEYNPSAESVRHERDAARERMRKVREKQRANRETAGEKGDSSAEQTANVRGAFGGSSPSPTRPDPTPKRTKNSSPPPAADDAFNDFWTAYPRKVGKGQARNAWTKATKTTEPETIVAAAQRYARERDGLDQTYTAHPSTWLNGERWTDQPTETRTAASSIDWWEN